MDDFADFIRSYVYEPIDLCACYDVTDTPPAKLLEEWRRLRETINPFHCTVERKIGNTRYLVETACDGNESLASKVKRLIFSDTEAIC